MASIRVALAILTLIATPASGITFGYLYIEANEGDSSGGHVAIRFGEQVYHFQHDDGLVRVRRDSWDRFEHLYRTLGNRGISISEIETSPETYEILRSAFRRRYIVEERETALLEALRNETRVLEALSASRVGASPAVLPVPGAGFFEPASRFEDSTDTRTLAAMRGRVIARHGESFLAERRQEVDRRLAVLEPTAPPIPPPSTTHYPAVEPLFAKRLADLHSATAALDLLAGPHHLRSNRLIHVAGRRRLSRDERSRMRAAASALAESLSRLVASKRPDWGYPFLLGMARLVALERSVESGRWILLETMPDDAEPLPLDSCRKRALPGLLVEAEGDCDTAMREAPAGDAFDEAKWTELENAATRVAELRRAQAGASALRVYSGIVLPSGEASLRVDSPARLTTEQLLDWLQRARRRERDYARKLREASGYDLLFRNCVSEIFRTIETALIETGVDPENLQDASRERLGGYIAPIAGLNFIPFVSAWRVRSRYRVVARVDLPSFRDYQVERMAERESPLLVALRESNVWTSTLYQPNQEDGFFVFFTDRTLLLRPVLGAVNLLAGALKSSIGLGRAPLDRGRSLRSGLYGELFSIPELVFVNLRKGSNDYVPRDMRPPHYAANGNAGPRPAEGGKHETLDYDRSRARSSPLRRSLRAGHIPVLRRDFTGPQELGSEQHAAVDHPREELKPARP
jgi:hypothetical protein